MKFLTMWEASAYLANALTHRDQRGWFGYLKNNSRDYLKQDGYRLNYHIANGKLVYTEAALKAFIVLSGGQK